MATPRTVRLNWLLILGFWAAMAGLLAWRALAQAGSVPLLGDPDDAMRIVTATDLLNGQAWQDLIQYRDNAPFGGSMHWSRLVDAPIALLIAMLGPDGAAIVWPLLLLLLLLTLAAANSKALAPAAGTLTPLVLVAVNLVLIIEFSPGRVDHHNVQILLLGGLLLVLLVGRERLAGGVLLGVMAATSLAIGIETLPLVVTAIAALALCWVIDPQRHRQALAGLGASFGLAMAGHFLLATAPAHYLAAACDAQSLAHVSAAGLGGAALLVLAISVREGGSPWQRIGWLAALGVATLVASAFAFPGCLSGPFAGIDARVVEQQFAVIDELQPLWARFGTDPATAIGFAGMVGLAVVVAAWRGWTEQGVRRADWLIVLGFLTVGAVFMLLQVRGARLVALFAIPVLSWSIAAARARYLDRQSLGTVSLLLASWLAGCTMLHWLAIGAALGAIRSNAPAPSDLVANARDVPRGHCRMEGDFALMATLPKGEIAAARGMGAHLLRYTPHSVLSAGYHRNAESIVDSIAFFAGGEAAALEIATRRGLDYVAICMGSDRYGPPGDANWPWTWVLPLSQPGESLQVYRIVIAQ